MVLLCQLENEFSGNNQRLLVSQGNSLFGLDGVDGRRESGKTDHGGEHHVDGFCLNYFVESLASGIHFDIGQVAHQTFEFVVALFVGNDDGGRLELMGLFGQQFYFVIGG